MGSVGRSHGPLKVKAGGPPTLTGFPLRVEPRLSPDRTDDPGMEVKLTLPTDRLSPVQLVKLV